MASANDSRQRVSASNVRYVFDGFEVDPANRTLVRDGKPIPLTGKVFDVLVIFAENPGRLLEKDELIQRIWNDAFVEEGNLARCVSNLRKALGDVDREHKYVSTVQGRGYRFVAPVVSTSSGPVEPSVTPQATPPARSARRRYWFMGAGLAGVAAIILAFIGFSGTRTTKPHISPIEQIRLTTGGKAGKAIIAPDGNSVVYTENQELKVKDLRNGSSRVLASAEPGNTYIALASPPKGQHVYFTTRPDRSIVSLYRIPFSGGAPEKVLDGVYGGISFSPDGSKFAFLRRYPELNAYGLIIVDADGSNLRNLALTHRPNNFDGIPAWSPDGKTILCSSIKTDGGFHYTILEVSVASGAVEEIPTRKWAWLGSLAWLPGSRELLIVAQDADAPNAQVWRLNRSTRETVRITDDTYIYESISGSLDGEKFVAIKKRLESHVWIVGETPTQVTTGFDKYDGVGGFAWAPKSQLYFHSRASGRDAVWRMNSDGSAAEETTPDGGSGFTLSPEGRYLVFQKLESTGLGLSRMDLSNGQVERLTERSTDMTPQFTPDGQSVVYCNFDEKHSLYKIATRGGQPAKLFDEYRTVSSPAVSADGTRIAFSFARAQSDSIRSGIAVISADDNRLIGTFDAKISFGTIYERPTVQWSPDGRYLNYIRLENGVSNVCRIDTSNGSVSEVTTFKSGRVFNFAFSPDGSRLAIARGGVESDVLVLKPTD